MKRFTMLMWVAAIFSGLVLLGRAGADDKPDGPPPKQDGGPRRGGPDGGGPGGPGGPPPGFHLIPRFAAEKMDLNDDQKKQIAELEKECKNKLAKILTADQMKTLETARPQRGGPGQGGPGGGGRGQGGGPGDKPGPGRGGPREGGDQDGPPKRQPPPSN